MRISDWSSDVCSSDLLQGEHVLVPVTPGFIAAQVVAGAEKAEIDDRHLPAGETASSPRSEDAFVEHLPKVVETDPPLSVVEVGQKLAAGEDRVGMQEMTGDRKSTRLNSSH